MKHAKVKTTIPQPDGSMKIDTKSYYKELNSIKEEIQQNILTDKTTFLSDLMKCVNVISDHESRELTLTIETDDKYQPIRIIKTWTVKKEYYGR